jgi:hypothetical protein
MSMSMSMSMSMTRLKRAMTSRMPFLSGNAPANSPVPAPRATTGTRLMRKSQQLFRLAQRSRVMRPEARGPLSGKFLALERAQALRFMKKRQVGHARAQLRHDRGPFVVDEQPVDRLVACIFIECLSARATWGEKAGNDALGHDPQESFSELRASLSSQRFTHRVSPSFASCCSLRSFRGFLLCSLFEACPHELPPRSLSCTSAVRSISTWHRALGSRAARSLGGKVDASRTAAFFYCLPQ